MTVKGIRRVLVGAGISSASSGNLISDISLHEIHWINMMNNGNYALLKTDKLTFNFSKKLVLIKDNEESKPWVWIDFDAIVGFSA